MTAPWWGAWPRSTKGVVCVAVLLALVVALLPAGVADGQGEEAPFRPLLHLVTERIAPEDFEGVAGGGIGVAATTPDGGIVAMFAGEAHEYEADPQGEPLARMYLHDVPVAGPPVRIDEGTSTPFVEAITPDARFLLYIQGEDLWQWERASGQRRRVGTVSGAPNARMSSDGSRVVFESHDTQGVAQDDNGTVDVFLWERDTEQITLVSRGVDGTSANSHSGSALIDTGGTRVVFDSRATNLTAERDPFVEPRRVWSYDIATGEISLVSRGPDGPADTDVSTLEGVGTKNAGLSDDASTVVFRSTARNLTTGITYPDGYTAGLFARAAGTTTLLTTSAADPTRAAVGRAFEWMVDGTGATTVISWDGEVLAGDAEPSPAGQPDVYLHQRDVGLRRLSVGPQTSTTTVSVDTSGRWVTWAEQRDASTADGRPAGSLVNNAMLYDATEDTRVILTPAVPGEEPAQDAGRAVIAWVARDGSLVNLSTNLRDIHPGLGQGNGNYTQDLFVIPIGPAGPLPAPVEPSDPPIVYAIEVAQAVQDGAGVLRAQPMTDGFDPDGAPLVYESSVGLVPEREVVVRLFLAGDEEPVHVGAGSAEQVTVDVTLTDARGETVELTLGPPEESEGGVLAPDPVTPLEGDAEAAQRLLESRVDQARSLDWLLPLEDHQLALPGVDDTGSTVEMSLRGYWGPAGDRVPLTPPIRVPFADSELGRLQLVELSGFAFGPAMGAARLQREVVSYAETVLPFSDLVLDHRSVAVQGSADIEASSAVVSSDPTACAGFLTAVRELLHREIAPADVYSATVWPLDPEVPCRADGHLPGWFAVPATPDDVAVGAFVSATPAPQGQEMSSRTADDATVGYFGFNPGGTPAFGPRRTEVEIVDPCLSRRCGIPSAMHRRDGCPWTCSAPRRLTDERP